MELNETDKALLKHLKLSEEDFQKLPEAEQDKTLKKALADYLKSKKNKRNQEFFKNAVDELPKFMESFDKKELRVYAKGIGQNESIADYIVVGYASNKKKILLANPRSESDKLIVHQADITEILKSDD